MILAIVLLLMPMETTMLQVVFSGSSTFGTTTLTSSGDKDIFVAKIDHNGNWLWANQAGGISYDYGRGIAVDDNGNSYITGEFEESATFGTTTLTSSGSYDIFVAKLDKSSGNWPWAKQAWGIVKMLALVLLLMPKEIAILPVFFMESAN